MHALPHDGKNAAMRVADFDEASFFAQCVKTKEWLPILHLLRTDWFKDIRDLTPALDSLIRPILLTHAH